MRPILIQLQRKDELQYWMTEHLRLNGVYWGLTALHLLNEPTALPRDATIEFVRACQNSDGGFGAAPGHDSHMLYTLSAVQVLAMVGALSHLEDNRCGGVDAVVKCELIYVFEMSNSSQSFHICKTRQPEHLQEINGENKTHVLSFVVCSH